jgi:hypothetical protein
MGRAARAAKAGASRRTTIPAAIGTRTVMATRRATAASGTCASLPKPRAISFKASGMNTMASKAAAISSPTA